MAKFEHLHEIAEYMKLHKGTILKLIKRYNLQSPMAKKQQKIAAELPDLYKNGLSSKEMAKYFEVSTATIKRRIKSLKSQGVLKD